MAGGYEAIRGPRASFGTGATSGYDIVRIAEPASNGERRPGRCGEAAGVAALVVVLLLLMPPHGFLLDNEEVYFGLAERAWSGGSADSAVFDASRHRLAHEAVLGPLVHAVGFEAAQAV